MVKMAIKTAEIRENGRVVIPKNVRDDLGVKKGDTLLFENISREELRVKVIRGEDSFLITIRNPKKGKAIKPSKLKEELWSG
ncbi:MAG: AbrB/MazE/SpoVT family DNA-binding domain-containing protein [Methanosarcinales archaeon Met12]|nr:MAG: AbrB/MazE/SpoVT family DNA-binding domain-containing protein [Methanosarcinales archaeon Met12]